MRLTYRVAFAALFASVACPALAQTSDWSFNGAVGIVSDYRYRGYSLTDGKPAVQGGFTAAHVSGVYGDVNLSTIAEYGVGPDGSGAELEVAATLGWAGQVHGFDIDLAAASYRYPRGDDVNYVELPLQIGRTHQFFAWAVGVAFAPSQTALGDENNRYGWTSLSYAPEQWPISISGSVGYEEGAFAPGGKTDWLISIARDFGPLSVDLSWTDSDASGGKAVASMFVHF